MTRIKATARLIIRRFALTDLPALHELDKDEEVMRFIRPVLTYLESKNNLDQILRDYERESPLGRFAIVEKSTDDLIGVCQLRFSEKVGEVELGYRFAKAKWGQGYATELTKALIDYSFEKLSLPKLIAITHPQNEASKKVLLKCGFRFKKVGHFYAAGDYLFVIERAPIT